MLPKLLVGLIGAASVVSGPATAWAAAAPTAQGAKVSVATGDLSQRAGHDPNVSVATMKLPPALCAAVNAARSGGAPTCSVLHYSYAVNGQSTGRVGRAVGSTAAAPATAAYWYWSQWDEVCAIYGCWYWNISLQEDGVANGSNVWQWNHYCTPSGYGTSITWCGYSQNGGGWPYYHMTFGTNFNACVGPWGIGCFSHGMRREINDWGYPGAFSVW